MNQHVVTEAEDRVVAAAGTFAWLTAVVTFNWAFEAYIRESLASILFSIIDRLCLQHALLPFPGRLYINWEQLIFLFALRWAFNDQLWHTCNRFAWVHVPDARLDIVSSSIVSKLLQNSTCWGRHFKFGLQLFLPRVKNARLKLRKLVLDCFLQQQLINGRLWGACQQPAFLLIKFQSTVWLLILHQNMTVTEDFKVASHRFESNVVFIGLKAHAPTTLQQGTFLYEIT